MDETLVDHIFSKQYTALLLFRPETDRAKYDDFFTELAREFKLELAFSYMDLADHSTREISETLGADPNNMPAVLVFDPKRQLKYRMTATITEDTVKEFILNWRTGQIEPYLKSEPTPKQDYESGVRTLVGRTFERIVFDTTKDILVEFYSPWCAHCKQLAPLYEELAREFKDNPRVLLAKIDMTVNEVAGESILEYPTVKMYPRNDKSGVLFEEDRTKAQLLEFIMKHSDKSDL